MVGVYIPHTKWLTCPFLSYLDPGPGGQMYTQLKTIFKGNSTSQHSLYHFMGIVPINKSDVLHPLYAIKSTCRYATIWDRLHHHVRSKVSMFSCVIKCLYTRGIKNKKKQSCVKWAWEEPKQVNTSFRSHHGIDSYAHMYLWVYVCMYVCS